jgi:GT2 family glycosyltransferase
VTERAGALGAAGKTVGLSSKTPAARFVDLMGGLDAQRYLQHPVYPFAPTANVLYRREHLLAIDGFDPRYATYDACDLHTRLTRRFGGTFSYEPRALVLHKHRPSWSAYWRQQFYYGVGYAQFMLARRRELRWSAAHQLRAACDVFAKAAMAMLPARGDDAILRRGRVIRAAAQQAGFLRTYYNPVERRKW